MNAARIAICTIYYGAPGNRLLLGLNESIMRDVVVAAVSHDEREEEREEFVRKNRYLFLKKNTSTS